MPRCCVKSCSWKPSAKIPTVSLHRLPKNEKLKQKWLESLGQENIKVSKTITFVCSQHFEESCINKTLDVVRLKENAIPTKLAKGLTMDEDSTESQLSKICRLCLKIQCNLFPITKYKLEDVFKNLTGLNINFKNELPFNLCSICAHKLQKYELFRSTCIETNSIMIDILKRHDNSILESIKETNKFENELQILTKIESYDLIVTEVDEKEININYKTEPEHDNYNENDSKDTLHEIAVNNSTDECNPEINDQFDSDVSLPIEQVNELKIELNEEETDVEVKAESEHDSSDSNDENNTIYIINENTENNDQLDSDDSLPIEQDHKQKKVLNKAKENKKVKKVLPKIDRRIKPMLNSIKTLFKVTYLTLEEQIAEIEKRKLTANYQSSLFKCEACFKGFWEKEAFSNHLAKHSKKSGEYECHICKSRFKNKNAVRKHITSCHIRKYSCKKCDYVTSQTQAAKSHERWHKGTQYSCPHCNEVFLKHTTYMSHVRIKHPSDFVCELCGYSYISEKGIFLHKRLKHKDDEMVVPSDGPCCELCNVKFATNDAYNTHLSISPRHVKDKKQRNEKKVSTKIRDRFIRSFRLKKKLAESIHFRKGQVEVEVNDPSECDDDGNKVEGEVKVPTLWKKYEGTMPCEQCGLELPDSKAYHAHFRKMHPDKNRTQYLTMKQPSMCEICGRMFQNPTLLNYHRLTHNGETPFKCEECGKAFALKHRLVAHRNVHASVKASYPCNVCGKQFSSRGNRHRHMLVHTGVKSIKCELCGREFNFAYEKRMHIAYVHLKKPWPKRIRPKRNKQPASTQSSPRGQEI